MQKFCFLEPDFVKIDKCLVEQLDISDEVEALEDLLLPISLLQVNDENIKNIAQIRIDFLYNQQRKAEAMIESTILLAEKMNATVITEYVENEKIFHILQKL
jgi:EAL domain-containing protein (putative c-di-GMP-specific phosphodiesterase class I)